MEIRWKQRFDHLKSAFLQLEKACDRLETINMQLSPNDYSEDVDYVRDSVVKRFELVFELAWKTMKDFFLAAGNSENYGSRDAIRLAFSEGMLADGNAWMDMVKTRVETTHMYDVGMIKESIEKITISYLPLFKKFISYLEEKRL